MSRWYRSGTASVSNGTTAVEGLLTAWQNQVKPGDSISFDGGERWYEVASIEDNTNLTLATAFAETTVTAGTYAIQRTSPLWSLASDLATQIGALLASQTDILTGTGAPSSGLGTIGSIYIDTITYRYYGPKTSDGWGDGVRLLMPTGFRYAFDTGTSVADPGAGTIRANNGTLTSATKLILSETDADGFSLSGEIASWFAGSSTKKASLAIRRETVPALLRCEVTGGTDNGGWVELTITGPSVAGVFADGDDVFITPEIVGDKGEIGNTGAAAALSLDMTWTSSTSGDPGSGKTGVNHATPSSATVWSVSETERLGADRAALLGTFDDSTNPRCARVEIVDVADSSKWLCFYITGALTDAGAYRTFPIEYVGAGSALTNGNRVSVIVTPIGNKGADGANGANGADGADGADGLGYDATSTSSVSIGSGSKSFVIGTDTAYAVGGRARAIHDGSNWVEGDITAYTGGTITLNVDKTAGSGTHATWTLMVAGKPGVDGAGDVSAAASFSNDNRLIRSDGTGKGVQASGITISDGDAISGVAGLALASGTITNVPTPTDDGHAANKSYVDGIAETLNLWNRKGVLDCSTNPNYPAANNGHVYFVSVAGKIGGGSGPDVEAGDVLICTVDSTASGDHATVGANWRIVQVNLVGALKTTDLGVTVQAYDANTAKLNVAQTWSKPQGGSEGTLTSATGWDGTDKQLWAATVNGSNFTIANPSAAVTGRYYAFYITYSSSHSLLLGNQFKGVSTLTFTNTSGAIDHFVARWNGTNMVVVGARMNIGA